MADLEKCDWHEDGQHRFIATEVCSCNTRRELANDVVVTEMEVTAGPVVVRMHRSSQGWMLRRNIPEMDYMTFPDHIPLKKSMDVKTFNVPHVVEKARKFAEEGETLFKLWESLRDAMKP